MRRAPLPTRTNRRFTNVEDYLPQGTIGRHERGHEPNRIGCRVSSSSRSPCSDRHPGPGRPRIGDKRFARREPTARLDVIPAAASMCSSRAATPGRTPRSTSGCGRKKSAVINGYGWVDRKAGIAHIPIDRAMDILARTGLPQGRPRPVPPACLPDLHPPGPKREEPKPSKIRTREQGPK